MPGLFGVIVTLIIIYYGPGEDAPTARWEERMSDVRCIAAVTQGILTEEMRKGSLANGGSITFGCQLDMPELREH